MDLLQDVKVVELSTFVAGPAAGGILADFGAEVIRVEQASGDIFRDAYTSLVGVTFKDPYSRSPSFYVDNRGKKSIVLDLKRQDCLEAFYKLCESADVFVSNQRASVLDKLGLNPRDMHKRFPHLIICPITAYGLEGGDASRPGYDVGAFWARSSAAWTHTREDDQNITSGASAFGDHATGMASVTGILAALHKQRITGKGDIVKTSLLRTGVYFNSWGIANNLQPRINKDLGGSGRVPTTPGGAGIRDKAANPLINVYKGKDQKSFWLLGYEADRHWPGVKAMMNSVGATYVNDEKFNSLRGRMKNNLELIKYMDTTFQTKNRDEWLKIFDDFQIWFQPVQDTAEVIHDQQIIANKMLAKIKPSKDDIKGYETLPSVGPPVGFESSGDDLVFNHVPTVGENTYEVLKSLGYTDEQIAKLGNPKGGKL